MAKILLIDDEHVIRIPICRMLEMRGYEVIEAVDGEEGLLRYRRERPDLVISDIMMPKKSGLEVARELRASFPDVKIIAITGHFSTSPTAIVEAGADHTLMKPIRMQELLDLVEDLLEDKNPNGTHPGC